MERGQRAPARGAPTLVGAEAEAEAIASYNALLRAQPDLGRETYRALAEVQHTDDLMMPGRLLCSVLRPRLLSVARAEQLARVSSVLASAFERMGELLLSSDRLLDLVGASDLERSIWEVNPGYPGFTLSSRLDSFMVGNEPRFVEYNAESPAGIGFGDRLTQIFRALPVMQRWEGYDSLRPYEGRRHLLETLLWAYDAWAEGGRLAGRAKALSYRGRAGGPLGRTLSYGSVQDGGDEFRGRGLPSMAIIDWDTVITKRDFELCGEYFRQHGIPVVIADPRSFEYRGGVLFHSGEPITLIYRRVLLHELLEKAEEAQPLLQAYRDGAVCMVNSPRSKLLHKKAVFALIGDPRLGLTLTKEEQAIVEATIPWTRLLVPGETTYGERRVDLLSFVLAEQERLVLKPVDDYGGRGVVLGWESSSEEWERALETGLQGQYIVQERVPVPQEDFPVWEEEAGQVEAIPLLVDTDPLLFRGQMGSVLTRISGSALLNVSAGAGSTTPTFALSL